MSRWNLVQMTKMETIHPLCIEFLPLFSTELSRSAVDFSIAANTENAADAIRLCHKMRGSASVYGFTTFADMLLESECLIKSGALMPSTISSDIIAIAAEISRLISSIELPKAD